MDENKAFVMEYAQALSGKPKDPALVAHYVADPNLAEHIAIFEAAFPCYELKAEDLIAEGDLVALRATFHGTHKGTFAGIAPTGRSVSLSIIIIYKITGRKIVQHWMESNSVTLLQQLTESAGAMQA